jgi:hypothetical protein
MDPITSHPLYRRHTIDTAMSSTWEFYKKNFIFLFVLSLVMSLISQYTASLINIQELQTITDPAQLIEKLKEYIAPMLIISLVNLYFTTVIQHYIIHKPIDSNYSFVHSLVQAFRYYIPFLILMILLAFFGTIAIVIGVFALIIGALFAALYVMTIYLFILPLLMVEGPNIGNTIARSFRLTHRNFWQNIGWVAVYIIILIVISVVLSAVIMLPFAGDFMKTILHPGEAANATNYVTSPVYIGLSALAGAITFPILPVFACVLYFNARASEDERQTVQPVQTEYRPTVEDLYAKPRQDENQES